MRHLLKVAVFATLILSTYNSVAQGVAVNNTGTIADTSAILDVSSTDKGFLPPRMTMAQRDAIVAPANGLMIYQTDNTIGVYCNIGSFSFPQWSLVGPTVPLSYGSFYIPYDISLSLGFNYIYYGYSAASSYNLYNGGSNIYINSFGTYHLTYIMHFMVGTDATSCMGELMINGNFIDARDVDINASGYGTITGDIITQLYPGDAVALEAIVNENGITLATETGSIYGLAVNSVQLNIQQIQ